MTADQVPARPYQPVDNEKNIREWIDAGLSKDYILRCLVNEDQMSMLDAEALYEKALCPPVQEPTWSEAEIQRLQALVDDQQQIIDELRKHLEVRPCSKINHVLQGERLAAMMQPEESVKHAAQVMFDNLVEAAGGIDNFLEKLDTLTLTLVAKPVEEAAVAAVAP